MNKGTVSSLVEIQKPCYSGCMVKNYRHPDLLFRGNLTNAARDMRHEPTPAEALLWERLRGRQLGGHRFHRQYAINRFIVDFACLKAALVIEVDGPVQQQQIDADQEREGILKALGFHIIRFTNTQVLEQIDQVLQEILKALA